MYFSLFMFLCHVLCCVLFFQCVVRVMPRNYHRFGGANTSGSGVPYCGPVNSMDEAETPQSMYLILSSICDILKLKNS